MNDIEILNNKIDNQYCQESKNNEVVKLIQDKSFSLRDRWNLYTKAVDSNYFIQKDYCYFIPRTLEQENFTLYDNAYVDRNQTYNYEVFFEDGLLETPTKELSNAELLRIGTIKEEILKEGYSCWLNDW